ncbi:cyclin-dependent kinase [Ophiostoma piceae UAMH 11346]|uniref:Cyclin-dependent kinase n=1 Tax=Ophiostoma piceae (strain UAMH 11346) TaxID=1262450 RepID=S3C558_OPHP1|nr:cyclin-dependent kinase [Ophiostoma piceae UAMH 11346]
MESPQRRVLAPRDANTSMATTASSAALPLSPPATIEPKKRALDTASDGPALTASVDETPSKKICLPPTYANSSSHANANSNANGHSTVPRPSLSPATSSVFDMSAAVNMSQGTAITEPDAPRHASVAREQARQRAEILKLRLGLARYKVRTGQVDVPLEQLRVVPAATQRYLLQGLQGRQQSTRLLLPPVTPQRRWQQPAQQTEDDEDRSSDDDVEDLPQQPRCQMDAVDLVEDSDASPPIVDHDREEDDDVPRLPQIRQASAQSGLPMSKPMPRLLTTPRGNRQLIEPTNITSSAMRGSAVSGLLSLARS